MVLGLVVIVVVAVIAIYVIQAIFLYKFNKLVYGKGSALAWIPICNIYLLGKLTINKIVGWILIGGIFLTATYKIEINGRETVYTILPENINSVVTTLYNFVVLGLFIYAIIKYNQIKKNGNVSAQSAQQSSLQNSTDQIMTQQNNQQAQYVQPVEQQIQQSNPQNSVNQTTQQNNSNNDIELL